MAERRRQNRKSGTSDENVNLKKRSRSEGPHGRRKVRNSMHEPSNKNTEFKQTSNGRHSMYTGHLSDDDDIWALQSESDSPDSDDAQQQWTKNPLMVRKSRKAERVSKTDKRRSMHNVENRKSGIEQSGQRSGRGRETNEYSRKFDSSPGGSQRAKFQRMEENRKKRIDMAVTSDEECSPQLRISRLRQRAMMSSQNADAEFIKDGLHIVPVRGESSFQAVRDLNTRNSHDIRNGHERLADYDDTRQSIYDENDNINGNFYQEYTKQQGVRRNKLPNVLPEFLPENRPQNRTDHANRNVTNQYQGVPLANQRFQKNSSSYGQDTRQNVTSESPKLRSFNEVKSNHPSPLKQANQKIELTQHSPNSSSDSLDDLIESNIQYLESEIESGKLKRQSGNYSIHTPEKIIQRQIVREPLKIQQTVSAQNDFRSRLQDPRSYVANKFTPAVRTVQPKVAQKTVVYPQPSGFAAERSAPQPRNQQVTEPRSVLMSGSATYSPYMERKTYDINEDLSKSDSQLNALHSQNVFQATRSYAPYPVLNKQTGNVMYVQPSEKDSEQVKSDVKPTVDSGMFSDVEYDIEVSERIKKWEKKLTPGELEEREKHKVLNTIKEYESFSDSNQKDSVPNTPVEVRRELWQLISPTSNSGVGKLSVNLTKSNSSISDTNIQESSASFCYEPKVVSSETNLHRIFRVVNEPRSRKPENRTEVSKPLAQPDSVTIQGRRKRYGEAPSFAQGVSNAALSESEIGTSMQQSWPPMAVDSDSGIRKSWRMSRYEEEINELKELVSDNVRDIRKRFDSDISETDTRRAASPVQQISPVQQTRHSALSSVQSVPVAAQPQNSSGMSKLTLNIQPVTPTSQRSPVTIRRKLTEQPSQNTQQSFAARGPQPVTGGPKFERKLPVYRNIPVETKSVSNLQAVAPPLQTTITEIKPPLTSEPSKGTETKPSQNPKVSAPEVWSPNLESRKGLVSMERVKARTLQTIPFSEDPVWKEIEGLTHFEKTDDVSKEVNFDEIDELLKIATGGVDSLKNRTNTSNPQNRMVTSEVFLTPVPTEAKNLMTQSYSPSVQSPSPLNKQRAFSDTNVQTAPSSKHVFKPPTIQPLRLNSKPVKKSSTSALDEVLEDIRASLQKKPLSPKLMKNIDTSESNSSTNLSHQSPLTKSTKAFNFPHEVKKVAPEVPAKPKTELTRSASATPGYDNTQASWKPAQHPAPVPPQAAHVPYIDPEFTQFPYIINGNYHLDPHLLSQKLKSTGLAHESSDEHSANRMKPHTRPANFGAMNGFSEPAAQQKHTTTSKAVAHELDQSVDDLRTLAQEVEFKLSQIKSRIVSADEARLDHILLALRKFAPMTEQTFFNVKFTPNYESEKNRRSKLEDALYELEKMYACLELDDKSMLDKATLREETLGYDRSNLQRRNSETASSVRHQKYERSNSLELGLGASTAPGNESKMLRRSQIEEIEKQTQNEFEDITKSFQVLLDEVTKQCRNIAQGSSRCSASDSNLFSDSVPQYSGQRPADEIRQEPPRQQLRVDTQSQRAVQDSYNTAIKELESVAMGNIRSPRKLEVKQSQPVQSVVYLNVDRVKPDSSVRKNVSPVSPVISTDIQFQSLSVTNNKNKPSTSTATGSNNFVSFATEFHKPAGATTVVRRSSDGDKQDVNRNAVSLQVELDNVKQESGTRVRGREGGRFRRRGNVEHRKSMPAITRSVETQTAETQTDSVDAETKGIPENMSKSLLTTTSDCKAVQKDSDELSDESSSDDEKVTKSKMRRSLSCPDIVALLEEFNRKEKESEKKMARVDKSVSKLGSKSATPKSAKQRHENKSRFRSLQNKDETLLKQSDVSKSATSDDGMEEPLSKPPVYPVWKYPGQIETPSVKKSETKKQVDREVMKSVSDTEQECVDVQVTSGGTVVTETVVRRRTRSVGYEQESGERPKSFHELVATFEQNPQRLEKIRMIGLRKCASEDSMFTDLILQKIYHSESDVKRVNLPESFQLDFK